MPATSSGGVERLDVDPLGRVPGQVLALHFLRGGGLPVGEVGCVSFGHGRMRGRRSVLAGCRAQCAPFGVSIISASTPPMSLGWTKTTGVPCAPIRGSPSTRRALGLELGLGGVDVGHLEADMMLPAGRVLGEEPRDRRVLAQRLDQLDLAVRRVDEADPHALRAAGRTARGSTVAPSRSRYIAIALLDRRRRDADMVEAAERLHASVIPRSAAAASPSRSTARSRHPVG